MNYDTTLFIANIASVASADGEFHPLELAQFELIKKHFKFSKTDWGKGEKKAQEVGFVPTPTGTFADKVQNLEMMLRVAYADGEASDDEIRLIMNFGALIGITQEQMDNLNADVVADVLADPICCPHCGMVVPSQSAFCSSCGAKLAGGEGEKLKFDIPSSGISITFSESTAATFNDALQLAKATGNYQEISRNKKKWFLAHFDHGDMRWLKMAEYIGSVRNKEVYEDGERKDWYDVFNWHMMQCLRERGKAFKSNQYCFGKCSTTSDYGYSSETNLNPWGCRCIKMTWNNYGASWLRFGKWEKPLLSRHYIWRFDKDRIRHAYKEAAKSVERCPHFIHSVDAVLALLPDTICPATDKDWKYHECYDELTPGTVKIVRKLDYGTETFMSDGPEPATLNVLKRIVLSVYEGGDLHQLFT